MKNCTKLVSKVLLVVMLVLLVSSSFASSFKSMENYYSGRAPKYVFVFIGDGMSFPQIASAEMFLGNRDKLSTIGLRGLNFTQFPASGAANTFDLSSFIPDSASTATSIATGYKTLAGVINMDVSKTIEYTPITEMLKEKGYKIGVVSSVPITHATPAAFYAKVPSRNDAYNIALQLADSGFEYFGGGAFQRVDGAEGNIFEILETKGYKVVNEKNDILNLNRKDGKVVAISPILDDTAMPYELDRKPGELSLADFVSKGIELLYNPTGFFMMVESGKIDWAGHANDAAASIHDTIAFAAAIEEALIFQKRFPEDTLIIVTGDHECGGLTIGFAGTAYETFFDKIGQVNMTHVEFNKVVNEYRNSTTIEKANIKDLAMDLKHAYGLLFPEDLYASYNSGMVLNAYEISRLEKALKQTMTPRNERNYSVEERLMYGGYEPLTITLSHIVNNKAGVQYTSFAHTALPVPVFAIGAGNELFNGYYDNTDIFFKMASILGLN
jgi:alkaline phosphatase